MPNRQGNNPKRRIVSINKIDQDAVDRLVNEAQYAGSPHHKQRPADYGSPSVRAATKHCATATGA